MNFNNILFHNVEELEKIEKGYTIWRLPKKVREKTNNLLKEDTARYGTGVELRFKMISDYVKLYLQAEESVEAQVAYIYYGSIQGGWKNSSKVIGNNITEIKISKPNNMNVLQKLTKEENLSFNPEVVRVILPYGKIIYHGMDGVIELPIKEDMPKETYLSYGSSITHGSLCLALPYNYCNRISQKLNCDYLNFGFAGSAHLEKEIAEYLVGRKDWSFASFELGINMIRFSEEDFRKIVVDFMKILSKDSRTMFFTDLFGNNQQEPYKTIGDSYRKIVKEEFYNILKQKRNAFFTEGKDLLNCKKYISQDLSHPSLEGMEEITNNWYKIMKKEFK